MGDEENNKQDELLFLNQKKEAEKLSLFGRFVDRIKNTFVSSGKKLSLEGRIQEALHENHPKQLDKLFESFLAVSHKLQAKLDKDLMEHVKIAMDQIQRDFRRIQRKSHHSNEESAEKAFQGWVLKARRWIELDEKLHDRVAIIETVIKQLLMDTDELIDQDLHVISDYETHILADLPITEEEKEELFQAIELNVRPHKKALEKLKKKPEDLELVEITNWKNQIDHYRSYHFEKALQAIDAIVASASIIEEVAEESNEMQTIQREVENLHQNTLNLLQKILSSDAYEKQNVLLELSILQEQARLLNSNLHLSPELFERLQGIQKDLTTIERALR